MANVKSPECELSEQDEARFWAKVALPDEQGCMLWLDAPALNGYGRFYLGQRTLYAHRVSYVLAYGPIPDGLQIDHVKERGCTNRHCVAPAHLEAVTQRENLLRGRGASAINAVKTHCVRGHAFDGANTYVMPNGRRRCRACNREWMRAHARRKAER